MEDRDRIQDLTERARSGDGTAFEELVEAHRERLEKLVHDRLRAHSVAATEAEDVVQEVLIRALRSIKRFQWRGQDSLLRWFGGIAEHVIVDLLRERGREGFDQLDSRISDGSVSPSRLMRRGERFERLEAALDRLSPDHRKVVVLARLEKVPIKEIATRLKRSPEAVSQLLMRAVQKLREAMEETESLHLPDRTIPRVGPEHGE